MGECLRPEALTCLVSESGPLSWVPMKRKAMSTHPHSVQLVRLVVKPRAALLLQVVMIDRTCCGGKEVGWREHRGSLGLAINLPCDLGQST